ncbi:MAG: tetratricopeptide repeat protein [Fischerella sp. CENA71]|nr:tetratricopeptide repeat protein [Fischerella sp. CENA71]
MLLKKHLSNADPNMAIAFNNLASFYRSQGRYGEAELLFLQAIPILSNTLKDNHFTTEIVWQNFTFLLLQVVQIVSSVKRCDRILLVILASAFALSFLSLLPISKIGYVH